MTSIAQDLIEIKAIMVAIWLIYLFTYERLWPRAPMPKAVMSGRWARLGRNIVLFGINTVLSPLIILPLTIYAADWGFDWRPAWWRGTGGLVLDLVLLDFWIYVWHRANHVVPFLWRFHVIHHYDRFLDSTTALRFHFGEVVLSAVARAVVIIIVGFPLESVILFEILVMLCTLFHHSNIRLWPFLEQGLSYLIVTPSIHWVHHHAVRRDTDSNYATLLSVWDRLFKTRSPTRRTEKMKIGVEGVTSDSGVAALLLKPFKKS